MSGQVLKRYPSKTQLFVILGIGLLLGVASVLLSPLWILVGVAGITYFVIVWGIPEIALLSILILTSTIIDVNSLPSIPIGFGHLLITDFLLFIPIGLIIFRSLAKLGFTFIHTPLDNPLLVFYITAILSTLIAIFISSTVTFNQSLGEIRDVSFYLTFFIVTNMIRDKQHFKRLWTGINLITFFVALAMIAQYSLGSAVPILPGRVETFGMARDSSYEVTRVLPPGQSLVLVLFISQLVLLIINRTRIGFIGKIIQIFILGLAVLLTFNRSFWVATALAMFLVIVLISIREKAKFLRIALFVSFFGAILVVPVSFILRDQVAGLINSATGRLVTIFNPDILNESSIKFREVENIYAIPQIASHPLIGMGLGAVYRPIDSRIDFGYNPSWNIRTYIHNGHLWLLLKTGLIGYISLMWLFYRFISRGFLNWRQISDPLYKSIMLSFFATIIGVLIATIVNPILNSTYWTPLIGIMMGMNEVILKIHHDQNHVSPLVDK